MTKAKKFQYQIQYTDNTYRIVDWTKAEYISIGEAIIAENKAIVMDDGIFTLYDIRTIVFIPEPEPLTEEEENQLSEYGGYDVDTIEWLKAQGIDPVNGGGKQ